MIVTMESRQPHSWLCKQPGHLTQICLRKSGEAPPAAATEGPHGKLAKPRESSKTSKQGRRVDWRSKKIEKSSWYLTEIQATTHPKASPQKTHLENYPVKDYSLQKEKDEKAIKKCPSPATDPPCKHKKKGWAEEEPPLFKAISTKNPKSSFFHMYMKKEEKLCSEPSNRTNNNTHQDTRIYGRMHGSSTNRSPEKKEGQQWKKIKKASQKAGLPPLSPQKKHHSTEQTETTEHIFTQYPEKPAQLQSSPAPFLNPKPSQIGFTAKKSTSNWKGRLCVGGALLNVGWLVGW